jgi:hypothetical protein
MRNGAVLAALGLLVSCADEKKSDSQARVTLRKVTGTSFELVPSDKQLPNCLVFTISANGVIRQLTMSRDNVSYSCPAGRPIGGHSYRVPLDEGTVKVHVLFSSQRVNAASIAQQLLDLRDRAQIASIDLRLPGQAAIETIPFTPEAEAAPPMGGLVGTDGVLATDAGSP